MRFGRQVQENTSANLSPFEFSALSSKLQKAIEERVKRFERNYPMSPENLSKIFYLEPASFSKNEIKYMARFGSLAVRQLFTGDVVSNKTLGIPVWQEESDILHHLRTGNNAILGGHHDVIHTAVECGKHPSDTSLAVLTPAFQRSASLQEQTADVQDQINNDEDAVNLWLDRSRKKLLGEIQEASSKEEFLKKDTTGVLQGSTRSAFNTAL